MNNKSEKVTFINGAVVALLHNGAADIVLDDPSNGYYNTFDQRNILHKGRYQSTYDLMEEDEISSLRPKYSITIRRGACDLINNLDLIINNPLKLPINQILECIECEIGGQRMDRISVYDINDGDYGDDGDDGDIETWIKTNYELFYKKRKTDFQEGNDIFIPILLAPFLDHILLPLNSLKYHSVKINIKLKNEFVKNNHGCKIQIWGYKYYLAEKQRIETEQLEHNMITLQNQYTGLEEMKKGRNVFRLNFNQPVCLIYFWGFNKDKIRNIRLLLNEHDYFSGTVNILEHLKHKKGYTFDPVAIFFSHDDFTNRTQGTINFSRINNATLIIESDQEEPCNVKIVGINTNLLRIVSGMSGLAYSK